MKIILTKKTFVLGGLLFVSCISLGNANKVNAISNEYTVYTNNCPRIEDWKHEFKNEHVKSTYNYKNLTGWIKKDPNNNVSISYEEKISGTISLGITKNDSISVGLNLMGLAVEGTNELSKSLTYSYTKEKINSYSWTINPNEPGNFFSIGVNYSTNRFTVKHYKQEFKWFRQGDYKYKSTSKVEIPTEHYLTKNYRYVIDGVTYEA